jgi:hypothetical protein
LTTEHVFLQGKAKWARLATADSYGNFKITLYPNEASLAKIKELQAAGIKNTLGKDDDGYFMTFRRPQSKTIKGRVVGFAPPTVVDREGLPLRDVMVGNNSDVTVKLESYKYSSPQGQKGLAVRLLGIKVDDLVPYFPDRDFTPEQKEEVRGLSEQPKQVDAW